MATFADWLSERLERRGLSIRQFALKVGVSPEAAGYWISGRSKPRKTQLNSIASVLEISESEVVRAWTDFKTDDEQTYVLKPGVIAEIYSPGGNRIRLTARLLKVLEAAAEPGEELLTVTEGEQAE